MSPEHWTPAEIVKAAVQFLFPASAFCAWFLYSCLLASKKQPVDRDEIFGPEENQQ